MTPGERDLACARDVLALAEEEHALIRDDRAEDLEAVHARRLLAMAALPDTLSDEARQTLRHALALQRQITGLLRDGVAAKGRELGQVAHGRQAAAGYAPAGTASRRALDRVA